jgi:diguanylate cyclase (GGDEF)-like protein
MRVNKNTHAPRSFLVEALAQSNARLERRVMELEQAVAIARHLAYHDSLTGLPNRALLQDRLAQAMQQAARQRKTVGLVLLDLDSFKHVNDQLGHHAGDRILRMVAERLTNCIRGCDTACRYGGDEFVILLPEIGGTDELVTVTTKVRGYLSQPHRIGDELVVVNASFGTAVFNEDNHTCSDLIRAV